MKKKIMIADDEKDIIEVLSLILEDAGYEVSSTANSETAKKVHEYLPDLLLLDVWMKGVDGRDICKYLKSQNVTKNIPIIMISAHNETKKIALEAGANDYITKPFDMDLLLSKVKENLNKKIGTLTI